MTAQCPETLLHRGEQLALHTEPLAPYLRASGTPIKFHAVSSGCWRGYQGTWTIEGERLYLVNIRGGSHTDTGWLERKLADLFPEYPDGVFAHWYSGVLRCAKGELLRYVHLGYGSQYEQDLFIEIARGVVVSERLVVNGVAEPHPSN